MSVNNNNNHNSNDRETREKERDRKRFLKYGICDTIHDYKVIKLIAKGSYGLCYKASCNKAEVPTDDNFVALKKVIMHNETADGFPITTLREIKILRLIRHPHCINLQKVIVDHDNVFLVFDYCENDLGNLIMNRHIQFTESEVKTLILQLLSGLSHIHSLNIIHRDLKLSNLLYNKMGMLKICDFGLARSVAKDMTNNVVTLWYCFSDNSLFNINVISNLAITITITGTVPRKSCLAVGSTTHRSMSGRVHASFVSYYCIAQSFQVTTSWIN